MQGVNLAVMENPMPTSLVVLYAVCMILAAACAGALVYLYPSVPLLLGLIAFGGLCGYIALRDPPPLPRTRPNNIRNGEHL